MSLQIEIAFTLNGVPRRASVDPAMSALVMLREVCSLTGTKYGCGEGECGACTIRVDGRSVASCLMFAVDCDGREITTIEGMAADRVGQALQRAFVEHGAIQCGFCMPGMIMQARHLADTNKDLTYDGLKRGLEGNVCRCTGYKKVFDAVADVIGIAK